MATSNTTLTTVVEHYLTDLRRIRASGGATGERSYYPALSALLNAVGATLKPKTFCVAEPAAQGAGHPDFGLYAAKQVQKGQPKDGHIPERGVVEVKSASDDAWLTAASAQVSRYWARYRLVLVTNTRDFVLVGEDASGHPATLETFRSAESAADFARRLETPRALARDIGAGLGEYLCRALSHRAALTEPKDVAWLLASYARDALARVEAVGDASQLTALRTALEEALGVRFEGVRGGGYTADELAALVGATGRSPLHGHTTFDVYLNGNAYWRNVPAAVWRYKLGGYQVLKKWLSYRERPILGRALCREEVWYFTEVARRIAAIVAATDNRVG